MKRYAGYAKKDSTADHASAEASGHITLPARMTKKPSSKTKGTVLSFSLRSSTEP
jgi:hypothetical protein